MATAEAAVSAAAAGWRGGNNLVVAEAAQLATAEAAVSADATALVRRAAVCVSAKALAQLRRQWRH